ncbi:MAG: sugar transferase [Rhodobacteraceae bacterium]|jgi:lipopolysaccharide/colanic/teichoic acid biosynthesis glycosyltransferase|nr:sugar transferase [Paracoccaceae bacterium]
MTLSKRLFDLFSALGMIILLSPVFLYLCLMILIKDGRPIFYVSERMKTPTKGFNLIKFRTMKPVAEDSGVSGGDKSSRITHTGAFLRRTRLDELPQVINVLKGDISFVGPRPPLRQYVEQYPEIYGKVLKSRPGVTGMASIYFNAHEERLLSRCRNREETDRVYRRICIPRKARLDLLYQKRNNVCFDMDLMLRSVFKRMR